MGVPVLEGADLGKRFGGLTVLSGVSFRVDEAEIVALIGPNGAGKTTLFNLISGLARPTTGRIRAGGHDITALPAFRISRLGVGRTFQTPRPFLELTALGNVRAASRFAERPAAAPEELLALVGLRADVPAGRLSVAMRKLLELAMALAIGPRILLLDEILAGLTPTEVKAALAALLSIRDRWGVALFWTEHVMHAVMATAERVIVLHHGEVIADGRPAAVVSDVRVREAYLGTFANEEDPR
jgi:branched-chain amino acid transport system ATP-binding protein